MARTLNPNAVLTTNEACKLLGVTRQTLYLWMQKGKIKPWLMVAGASWLFERAEVEKLKGKRYEHEHAK